MKFIRFDLEGESATRRLGSILAKSLRGGERIALIGPLGAGKTTLVKGIAEGLGIPADRVISPTFVLHRVYHGGREGIRTLHHVDAYRLSGPGEFEALGIEESLGGDAVIAVEWADHLPEFLEASDLKIVLAHAAGEARNVYMEGNIVEGLGDR